MDVLVTVGVKVGVLVRVLVGVGLATGGGQFVKLHNPIIV